MEMGIPSGATANLDTPSRQSYDAISNGFGEGFNGPLLLVAKPKGASDKVTPELLNGLVQDLGKHENVSLVTPMGVNKTGDMAIISLIPKTGPTDAETKNLVREIRASDSSMALTYDVTVGVTGFTAINIDMSSKLAEVFPLYVGIIVILSLIILLLVFRSIIVPLKATVGFLLSVLATFGITTAVYQWGWLHSLFGFDTAVRCSALCRLWLRAFFTVLRWIIKCSSSAPCASLTYMVITEQRVSFTATIRPAV